ncbi:hypothetical protein TNCV_4992501 [Trichonephila clavipes]|nr:hypothetical protein TNCV_4992501 [Trichonephila clavipes]
MLVVCETIVSSLILERKDYQHKLEYDTGRIVTYREFDGFRRVTLNTLKHLNTLLPLAPERIDRVSNRSYSPIMEPQSGNQESGLFAPRHFHGQCKNIWCCSEFLYSDRGHYYDFPSHCNIETHTGSVVLIDKTDVKVATRCLFRLAPVFYA